MNSYPTKLLEIFNAKVVNIYYGTSITEAITNNDWEGLIKDKASILNVLTFGALDAHDYIGADMIADDLTESNAQLVTNQAKYFYFRVLSYDKFRSMIKNPEGTVLTQIASRLKQIVDYFILSNFYTDVASGNRLGTDETTGTVTIDVSGNVTGAGTAFAATMVGRGFKATGHSVWYRVKTFTSATAIVIEDDADDLTTAYSGGVIGAGATFTIEAVTAVQLTKTNVFDYFSKAQEILDDREVPEDQRWAALPPAVFTLIKESSEFNAYSAEARDEAIKRGYAGQFAGFKLYKAPSQRLPGNKTSGWHVLLGHKSAIAFAMGLTETGTEDAIANFGQKYKSLYVYGAKVPDERRKALAEIFAKL